MSKYIRQFAIALAIVVFLYVLSNGQMIPPGNTDARPNPRKDEPFGVDDFRKETNSKHPEIIYRYFTAAVDCQLRGDHKNAEKYYNQLRQWPLASGGTRDLAITSNCFKHNLRLMGVIVY